MASALHAFLSHRYRVAAAAGAAFLIVRDGFGREIISGRFSASLRALFLGWVGHLGVEEQLLHGARLVLLALLLTVGADVGGRGRGSLGAAAARGGTRSLCPHPQPTEPLWCQLRSRSHLCLVPAGCLPAWWPRCTHQVPRQTAMQPGRGQSQYLLISHLKLIPRKLKHSF